MKGFPLSIRALRERFPGARRWIQCRIVTDDGRSFIFEGKVPKDTSMKIAEMLFTHFCLSGAVASDQHGVSPDKALR